MAVMRVALGAHVTGSATTAATATTTAVTTVAAAHAALTLLVGGRFLLIRLI